MRRQAGASWSWWTSTTSRYLDALGEPDTARANREFLRGLYATIKDCDASARFTLLTGEPLHAVRARATRVYRPAV